MAVVLDVRVVTGMGGGPEKTIVNSPRFLAPHGYRMLCAYMHSPNDSGFEHLSAKAMAQGAELLSVIDHGPLDWNVVPQLVRLCKENDVRIWHGHDYKSNVLGLIVKRFWPMRLVTTVHGWVQQTRRTPLYYWLDRMSLRYYEKVICVSPDLYHTCRRIGVSSSRCSLLENGIDADAFCRSKTVAEAKKALSLPSDRKVVGAAGRLSPEKGFDLLVRGVDRLLANGQDLQLLIFGEGPERASLSSLITSLGRTDRIQLMGYQSNLRPYYEAMDVFVLSSLREGLPNVILEAMAMEVPVIATRVAGIPRLVRDGENGNVVEPGSIDEIVRSLSHMLCDEERRKKYSQAARSVVTTKYSFAKRMHKLKDLYDHLLAHPLAS
jgi:glycosyltransferase involved in cell wall biosynthesis